VEAWLTDFEDDFMANEHIPARENKLLTLHHELFYPAFLGAVLSEFIWRVYSDIEHSSFELFPRFASALWFLFYFSAAFLSLVYAERQQEASGKLEFGWLAFLAKFLEIGLIVLVSLALGVVEKVETHKFDNHLYEVIYFGWIAIPFTALVANLYSHRAIKTRLSVLAVVVGLVGWSLGRLEVVKPDILYPFLFIVMCAVLFAYFVTLSGHEALFNTSQIGTG
jgi:hypothetical protein